MSASRIVLCFEHSTCAVLVDITLPLPDPIVEGAETMADRIRPTCPICKNPTDYIGFCFDAEEDHSDHPGRDEKLKEALEEALGGWSGAIGGFPWSPDSEKRDRARIAELEKLL